MLIKEITVEVHEKRNNPASYGHKDCSVRITVAINGSEREVDPYRIADIEEMREIARNQVNAELDQWIASLSTEMNAPEDLPFP